MHAQVYASKTALAVALVLIMVAWAGGTATADGQSAGHVYTMTNGTTPAGGPNAVVVFNRADDGTLMRSGTFFTGGTSIAKFATGSQNGVILSKDEQCLFAVNSLSGTISAFRVMGDSLRISSQVGSGGDNRPGNRPISVTEHDGLLYALNAGGQLKDEGTCDDCSDSITGFIVGRNCGLLPLPDSTLPLSAGSTSPAQISFTPNGRVLVVTEKATDMITTYTVGHDGRPSGPNPQPVPPEDATPRREPFGFTFDSRGQLLVTEAACRMLALPGNLPGCQPEDKPALSSWEVADDGTLSFIERSVDDQAAKCWVVATDSKRQSFAYTVNALAGPATGPFGSITGYRIDHNGSLTPLVPPTPIPATALGVPVDAALSNDSRFLYVLHEADGIISAYRVEANGDLTPLVPSSFAVTDMPPIATNGPFPNGLAAR